MRSELLSDLYELTMLEAYAEHGMSETAVFEFFVRKLPARRNFLVGAGLEQLLEFLEAFRFDEQDLEALARTGRFSPKLIELLAGLRFTGDVHAMPEGTIFFADEPLVRITAPLPEAQIIESRLINLLHFQTLIASKAARSVLVAPGKLLVDFGLRRAHGAEAGYLSARAAYIAGFAGTSTVAAGLELGIPLYGTMAHSFVQAHDDELVAFERFARAHPDAVLLIDTYDTEQGAKKVAQLSRRLAAEGIRIGGVRLDSGDLAFHSRAVRRILDEEGAGHVRIFASGSLDEHAVRDLVEGGAPIDGFGIGTLLDTSADMPYLDCAYKLEEYAGRPRRKRSEGKATWPGRKQVYRLFDERGTMIRDTVSLEEEPHPGAPLLLSVMRHGKRLAPPEPLTAIRTRAEDGLSRLPRALRRLEPAHPYPVEIAASLRELADRIAPAVPGAGERSSASPGGP